MTTVQLIRGAETLDLSSGTPYWALEITGVGLPPVRLTKERGPQQHGSTVTGFTLDERMINLAVLIKSSTLALGVQHRDDLAEFLKPVENVALNLKVTRDDDSVRQIDCYPVGMIDFPNTSADRFAGSQRVVMQFEAPDPIPYDPTLNNVIFDTSGGQGFTVPLNVPLSYTTGSGINRLVSLVYTGKWQVFPVIYVTGPAEDLVITNETTGKVLDFTGHTIAIGRTYEIDLRYGYKLITDDTGVRQNAALTDDSNLVDWGLVPTPTAPGGVNDIRVEVAAQATTDTQVRVEFNDKYPSLD